MDFHSYSNVKGMEVLNAFQKTPKEPHDVDMVYRLGRIHGIMDVLYALTEILDGCGEGDIKAFARDLLDDTQGYSIGAIMDDMDASGDYL